MSGLRTTLCVSVASSARPAVGRTLCAEIVHGARTKKIERNSYDGLPAYAGEGLFEGRAVVRLPRRFGRRPR